MNNSALIAFADKLKWAARTLANVDCVGILSGITTGVIQDGILSESDGQRTRAEVEERN